MRAASPPVPCGAGPPWAPPASFGAGCAARGRAAQLARDVLLELLLLRLGLLRVALTRRGLLSAAERRQREDGGEHARRDRRSHVSSPGARGAPRPVRSCVRSTRSEWARRGFEATRYAGTGGDWPGIAPSGAPATGGKPGREDHLAGEDRRRGEVGRRARRHVRRARLADRARVTAAAARVVVMDVRDDRGEREVGGEGGCDERAHSEGRIVETGRRCQANRPDARPGRRVRIHPARTPAARSAAISPSSSPASRSTASPCSPSRGAGRRGASSPRSRTGVAIPGIGLPSPRRGHLHERATRGEVRIRARLVALEHRREAHVVLRREGRPLVARTRREDRLELRARAGAAVLVLPRRELGPADGVAEGSEELGLERAERHEAPVLRAVYAVGGGPAGERLPSAHERRPARPRHREGERHERDRALHHRHVDVGALPGRRAPDERRKHARHRRPGSAGEIRHLHARG